MFKISIASIVAGNYVQESINEIIVRSSAYKSKSLLSVVCSIEENRVFFKCEIFPRIVHSAKSRDSLYVSASEYRVFR